jgi:hypothetical protein
MEAIRDQVTLDHVKRPWTTFNDVEQGSLLVELSASLRRRLMVLEADQELARAYRTFAHAARVTGSALVDKHRVPFVPTPPFQWSTLHLDEVNSRVHEITSWATATAVSDRQSMGLRHTDLDLSQAGHGLERQLERIRVR